MSSFGTFAKVIFALLFAQLWVNAPLSLAYNVGGGDNVAIYWGQNGEFSSFINIYSVVIRTLQY
jgi:hypothetical protein